MNLIPLVSLIITSVLILILFIFIDKTKSHSQIKKAFTFTIVCLLICCIGQILQIVFSNTDIEPIYFDYFVYIGTCFLPVAFLFISIIFAKTKIKFGKKHLLLFVIPTVSLLLLWTNDFHHLFYKQYSTDASSTVFGSYFYVHYYYTIILFAISLLTLMGYSIKNSGFFSKQAILIFIGGLVPVTSNILSFLGIISGSIYITPITFAITIICFAFAMFKFNFLKLAPIALQKIVDRISDSYLVLNENYNITDYNETFVDTFSSKGTVLRGEDIFKLSDKIQNFQIDNSVFKEHLKKIKNSTLVSEFEQTMEPTGQTFSIELSNIFNNGTLLGILVLFKDITQHKKDIQKIQNNQDMLIEQERLASLGQMVGGIAHNLKTPIFSVAGGLEGLSDLINEFDASIGNSIVTNEDMHDIAKDMREWVDKLRSHISYMSDVITTVKGQTVTMADNASVDFSVTELFKRVDILMKHEVKNALAVLEITNNVGSASILTGNINSLVQIINNIISNAIEAYSNSYTDKKIELVADITETNIIISIKDYGPGISEIAQKKLFKEMITTKGKKGTGLGMFMSYSNIKAHFNGNLHYETELGKGTTFYITLPIKYY